MASIESVFDAAACKFNISCLNRHQKTAIRTLIIEKKNVFVNLPTGFGKSLMYQALPFVIDTLSKRPGHIVAVVSPLLSLMDDQVTYLTDIGISAINISTCKKEDYNDIEAGKYSIVYGSPEAWLMNSRWRNLFNSDVYSTRLCALAVDEAHVIRQWGISHDTKKSAFREAYGKLYELRSLIPKVPVIALTATATQITVECIMSILCIEDCFKIEESPNKVNVSYAVECMQKDTELEFYFTWLTDELKCKEKHCERTIIYCQTIKQCSVIYATLKGILGNCMFAKDDNSVLVEMLHSCTPEVNKKYILESFQKENGAIRVLVATIAFGMGIDCKAVHRIIHYGPSKTVEAYVQETGRAGRDGMQCSTFILYHGILLNHVDVNIKSFVKTKECRRKSLMKHFENESASTLYLHLCCDNCAAICKCGQADCGQYTKFPSTDFSKDVLFSGRKRDVSNEEKTLVENALVRYHKELLFELANTTAKGDIKTLTDIRLMLGFSEHQITQVLENIDRIFTMSDVYNAVEIWDTRHAENILSTLNSVFGDILANEYIHDSINELVWDIQALEFDDELLDEWQEILQDDDMFNMIIENLSLSQLQDSLMDEHDVSSDSQGEELIVDEQENGLHYNNV